MSTILLLGTFLVVALAAAAFGDGFRRIKLPAITGFLFAGALAGSFALDIIDSDTTSRLRFVDEIALGIIAFVAGSELYLKEIRPRLRPILGITTGIVAFAYLVLVAGVFALTGVASFTADLDLGARFATALLGAAVLLALSPPSTIAVIKEVRARGRFTRTVLGITITMDVAIIVLFATMTSIASPLLTNASLDPSFALLLALDLALAVVIGIGAGQLLRWVLTLAVAEAAKIGVVLALSFAIFELTRVVATWSLATLGFEVYIEPLLIALVAGFFVTNFTEVRNEFGDLLHRVGPPVYVAFFTLTGISLKLDVLWTVLPFALALFALRAVGIAGGTWLGARWAGEPSRHQRLFWAACITQAGIALGLAREVAVQFPALGDTFATLIISVVVINEIVGPLFLKTALRRTGEAHEPPPRAGGRRVVVLGVEGQSLELARALQRMDWTVVVADTDSEQVARLAAEDVEEVHIPDTSPATLGTIIDDRTVALVAMLPDDSVNAHALTIAKDLGVQRLIARPAHASSNGAYEDVDDIIVVDPATAIVSLLEQAVTSPQSATLLLRRDDAERRVTQIRISNPDVDGTQVRDLRLPGDALLLQLLRDGSTVVVTGHTTLRLGDEVTVLAGSDGLTAAEMRLAV